MFSPFEKIKVEIFGASHADEIGVRLTGIPRGEKVDVKAVQAFVDSRKASDNVWSTPRKEPDEVIIKSGVTDGVTDGNKILAVIKNKAQRSSDYSPYRLTPRPSHADYVAIVKDKENADLNGGGRFSGRMTAPICIAGGIVIEILKRNGIEIGAYVSEVGGVKGRSYNDAEITMDEIIKAHCENDFALSNTGAMIDKIKECAMRGDSVGGKAECIVYGLPVGVGDALFDGLESKISAAVFAVPAVKAVEFGLGCGFSGACGSNVNDAFCVVDKKIKTVTNNNGGINGGISNGMLLTVRATLKPTPSISIPQKTVNLETMQETTIEIKGRHDACIVPRAVAGIKACVALAVYDAMLKENLLK